MYEFIQAFVPWVADPDVNTLMTLSTIKRLDLGLLADSQPTLFRPVKFYDSKI